jgi:hypothetical protein
MIGRRLSQAEAKKLLAKFEQTSGTVGSFEVHYHPL